MQDKNAPINNLLNRQYILDILNTDGTAFTRPWFGQLMTGPQLMAYLCQVNMWLEKYEPKLSYKKKEVLFEEPLFIFNCILPNLFYFYYSKSSGTNTFPP